MTSASNTPLLEVRNLRKYFPIQKGFFKKTIGNVRAVDDVSFFVEEGETLGLVGESGCGKTTTVALHRARHRPLERPDAVPHRRRAGGRSGQRWTGPRCGRCGRRCR